MNESHETLLARFIDERETLSDDEFAALLAALRADRELSILLKDLLIVGDVFAQIHSIDRQNFRAQVAARLRDMKNGGGMRADVLIKRFSEPHLKRIQPEHTFNWRMAAILAACVAIALLADLLFRTPNGGPGKSEPLAVLKTTAPGVRLRRGVENITVGAGTQILSDDSLVNPLESDIQVALLGQESTFSVGGGTHILFVRTSSGLWIQLAQGSLRAVLAAQPKDRPLVISTASAEISIVGTELSVTADSNETKVEVAKGSVKVVRIEDGQSVQVESNQVTHVAPGREMVILTAQPKSGEKDTPKKPETAGGEGWQKLFDGKTLNGWKPEKGKWAIEDGALVATADKTFDHAALMSKEEYTDFELRFKYKAEGRIYAEFKVRVADSGTTEVELKEKNTPWRLCVIKISGESRSATIDGAEQSLEIMGKLASSGHIRFYMENRGSEGAGKLHIKDIELRPIGK